MIKTTNNLMMGVLGKRTLSVIYAKSALVWQAVRSCFGRGFWIKDKPWNNEDNWKNNS